MGWDGNRGSGSGVAKAAAVLLEEDPLGVGPVPLGAGCLGRLLIAQARWLHAATLGGGAKQVDKALALLDPVISVTEVLQVA